MILFSLERPLCGRVSEWVMATTSRSVGLPKISSTFFVSNKTNHHGTRPSECAVKQMSAWQSLYQTSTNPFDCSCLTLFETREPPFFRKEPGSRSLRHRRSAGFVFGRAVANSDFIFGSFTTITSQHCVLAQEGDHLNASIKVEMLLRNKIGSIFPECFVSL